LNVKPQIRRTNFSGLSGEEKVCYNRIEKNQVAEMVELRTKVCKLCHHNQFKILFDRDFKVVLCRRCGLIFVDDNDRDYSKYYAEEYDYRIGEDDHFINDKKLNEAIFKWVIEHLPPSENLTLLEIGCNAGFLLKRFEEHGFNVFGIEPGKKAAAFATRVNGLSQIKCGLLEDIEKMGQVYDAVILIQTFEHFKDPSNSLLKISSFLKNNGLLFIEVPNYYALNGFYSFKKGGEDCPSPNHLFVYTPKTLAAFLRKAGFSCQTSYTLRSIRVVARKIDKPDKKIEFENYYKVLTYFYMLPFLHKGIDIISFFKNKLIPNPTMTPSKCER
jgi:2-polyprenyl-3-methyl-5-hydroxy-6-metoxy-1,4-benzoquinol methylase